jgi:transcriptional regulator with XRE-family HTH domain
MISTSAPAHLAMPSCRTFFVEWMGLACVADASFSPDALRRARLQAHLSQEQLAAMVGVSGRARVSVWERGVERPGVSVVPRLAAALGVDVSALYKGSDGASLAVLRRGAGLSLDELARRAGLSSTRYRRIEHGRHPSEQEIGRIAAVLSIPDATVRQSLPPRSGDRGEEKPSG